MLYRKFYGQQKVISTVISLLSRRQPVLLCGDSGIGKSAISIELLKRLSNEGKLCLYIPLITSRKPFLRDLLFQLSLYADTTLPEKQVLADGTSAQVLLGEIYKAVSQLDKCICIVEVERLIDSAKKDIFQLMQRGMIFVLVSRSSSIKDFDEKLEKVKVAQLREAEARAWIQDFLTTKKVDGKTAEHLTKWLIRKSGCHPGAIVEAFAQWENEPLDKEITQKTSIRKAVKKRYMYVPVSIAFVMLMMANRPLSRVLHGGGDRVDYVVGALGWAIAVTYLVFVFNYFKKATLQDGAF